MGWVYYVKLFDSEFQAGCLAARMKNEMWLGWPLSPAYVGVYRTKRGRYGVKYLI
jgi:hypothetical protein